MHRIRMITTRLKIPPAAPTTTKKVRLPISKMLLLSDTVIVKAIELLAIITFSSDVAVAVDVFMF